MQIKRCLLFVLLIGSIIASTDGHIVPYGTNGKEEGGTESILALMSTGVLFVTTLSSCFFFFLVLPVFLNSSHRFCLIRTITVNR